MKEKALMLMFFVIFAAFTTLAVVTSSVQMNEENSNFADSYGTIEVNGELVRPCGLPIDSPGGPT